MDPLGFIKRACNVKLGFLDFLLPIGEDFDVKDNALAGIEVGGDGAGWTRAVLEVRGACNGGKSLLGAGRRTPHSLLSALLQYHRSLSVSFLFQSRILKTDNSGVVSRMRIVIISCKS